MVEIFARCDTVFLNRCSDAAGESSLDIAISLFQLGIPHSPFWYSFVSRRFFSLGAASLFAATFLLCETASSPQSQFLSAFLF